MYNALKVTVQATSAGEEPHEITLEVSDDVLAERKKNLVMPEPKVKTGYLARYAKMVTSADKGAVLSL